MSGDRTGAKERRAARAAENSRGTAAARNPIPGNRPFAPGQSGNPGGRPRGMAAAVKALVTPDAIAQGFYEIAVDGRAKPAERIAAWRELADRGWGKAPAFAAIEGSDPLELGAIAQEIQQIADELAARRAPVSDSPASQAATG